MTYLSVHTLSNLNSYGPIVTMATLSTESIKLEEAITPAGSDVAVEAPVDYTLRKRPWRKTPTAFLTILHHQYHGNGTAESPHIVTWLPNDDPENPLKYPAGVKWGSTFCASTATMVVSMASSMLSAAIVDIKQDFPEHPAQSYVMGKLHLAPLSHHQYYRCPSPWCSCHSDRRICPGFRGWTDRVCALL